VNPAFTGITIFNRSEKIMSLQAELTAQFMFVIDNQGIYANVTQLYCCTDPGRSATDN